MDIVLPAHGDWCYVLVWVKGVPVRIYRNELERQVDARVTA